MAEQTEPRHRGALSSLATMTNPREMRRAAIAALTGDSAPRLIDEREAAIMVLTLSDAETPDAYRSWRQHWLGKIDTMMASEHAGDCTNIPGPCLRCHAEEAFRLAPTYQLAVAIGLRVAGSDDCHGTLPYREAMLMHLGLIDVDEPDDYLRWRSHWNDQLEAVLRQPHGGDCTGDPIACMRCLAEEAYQMAPVYQTAVTIAANHKNV